MAIPADAGEIVSAIDCVPLCDTALDLSDSQFFLTLIDLLLTETGIDLSDITAADLADANNTARCDLQDRVTFSTASPEKLKAIALYLAQNLA